MQQNLLYNSPEDAYGSAINYVRVDKDGKMWVGNGEYKSQVNFCPFTGTPAPTQMKTINQESYKEYTNE